MRALLVCSMAGVIGVAACALGRKVDAHEVARAPAGIEITVRAAKSGEVKGELLAADDSSLFVMVPPGRVAEVRYRDVRWIELRKYRSFDTRGQVPRPAERRRWSAVARFPQGLSDELLARLLAQSGQPAVEILQ
ncbi:MAG TPA: hypothetical protein VK939_03710 [Longimicrobiales bacterium]|nr:hypothetical protein [Longimicrobiales bacterium]